MSEYKLSNGKTLRVEQEEYPENPRTTWDNLGTMVCFHTRYVLGDKDTGYNFRDYASFKEVLEAINKKENPVAILPIYMYDHSGITIATTPFSCKWDSGQIGYIFLSKKKAIEEYGENYEVEKIKEYLENEVKIYDQYLTGDVYGFTVINKEGEEEDSCWGFYGSDPNTNGMMDNFSNDVTIVNGSDI